MRRDVRPLTLTWKGRSITVAMPGWYAPGSDASVHTGLDMKISDRALHRLEAEAQRLDGRLGGRP
jgi:HTH-type transcriptional regulator/antitoxin MqsA